MCIVLTIAALTVLYQSALIVSFQPHHTSHLAGIFPLSKKLWFHYILDFLELQTNEETSNIVTLFCMRESLLKHGRELLYLRYARIKVPQCCSKVWRMKNPGGVKVPCVRDNRPFWYVDEKTVTRASGKLYTKHSPSTPLSQTSLSKHHCNFYGFVWIFKTDKLFHTNLTFHSLYFSSHSFQCHMGRVVVMNVNHKENNFTFCGTHPAFRLSPPYSHFIVNMTTYTCIKSELDAYFSIQDAHLLQNMPWTRIFSDKNLVSSVLFLENKIELTFLVQVAKLCMIVLDAADNASSVTLFDGPSTALAPLMFTGRLFHSSTFQCLMQMVSTLEFLVEVGQFTHRSHRSSGEEVFQVQSNDRKIHLQSSRFRKSRTITVVTSKHYFINASVYHMFYTGTEDYKCTFGGLVFAEYLVWGYNESPTLCTSHDHAISQNRMFYSHGPFFIVFMYWYTHLSNINTDIHISVTTCKLIQFNQSKIKDLCYSQARLDIPFSLLIESGDDTAVKIMHKRQWNFHILPLPELYFFYMYEPEVLTSEMCFTIQFTDTVDACDLYLLAPPSGVPDLVHLTLRGAIIHTFTRNNSNCLFKFWGYNRYRFNTMDILGYPTKATFELNNRTKMTKAGGDEPVVQFSNQWGLTEVNSYFISLSYRGPTRSRHLKIMHHASPWAQHSWMEVSVTVKPSQTELHQSFEHKYFSVEIRESVI